MYKIHSARLRRERWKLTLTQQEARRNDEVISLSDSQILRWIDELNGVTDTEERAGEIWREIRSLRKEKDNPQSKRTIRKLYQELDSVQFKPDYLCLIIDTVKDYQRACKGFSINGIRYRRLLGTNGGIKNSTIVFVSERLHDELERRIENGRRTDKALVTAKLEAYRALTCSASTPVSMPNGILVVPDAETEFTSDVLFLSDENDGEPIMEQRDGERLTLDATDGCGLMLPSLAERWSHELGLGYTASGFNTRFSFEKGMVFPFDFIDFAERVAGSYLVRDAWGHEVDIRNVELVLTTSMVKLWDFYDSCRDYVETSLANGYTFSVTKACPRTLENERTSNYQFLQPFTFDDEDLDELIGPTMREFHEVLGGDWRKAVLFLAGLGLNDRNISRVREDYLKAIMIEPALVNDPYVQNTIYSQIRNRINKAKIGVIKMHGNYSILSGDPYLLCQSMFGLEKTGLLKAGEIYNEYWADDGAERLVCFRAPMTCFNNIRPVTPVRHEEARYWFRYLHTATVFNSWDTAPMALNGCDFDGDQVMLTDNPVLLRRLTLMPALVCAQRKAVKTIPTQQDFIRSNIDSFGNDIGRTTNWVTSMFEVRSHFPEDSEEYQTLSYRIRCGQLYQQNAIDKAKGIICKPMPRVWYDRYAVERIEDPGKRRYYKRILADKKPYFMRYIYPALMKQYNTYLKNTNKNALREFSMTVEELRALPEEARTDRMREFLDFYDLLMPVGLGDCVMNRICRRFETAFDSTIQRRADIGAFDYHILRSDAEYSPRQYNEIRKLYRDYTRRVRGYKVFTDYERTSQEEAAAVLQKMNMEFRKACDLICPDGRALCNIVLDLCYTNNATKQFAWGVCGAEIVQNLLDTHDGRISYPVQDEDGDLTYCGVTFAVHTQKIGVDENGRTE